MINTTIRRCTTPTLEIYTTQDLREASEIYLTMKQQDVFGDPWEPAPPGVFRFDIQRMDVEEKKIKIRLTKTETLELSADTDLSAQIVATFIDGTTVASAPMWGLVGDVLDEGVQDG